MSQQLQWVALSIADVRMATQASKSSLVAPILMATPTGTFVSNSRLPPTQEILTALEHLVTAFTDDVKTDDLLIRTSANELICCGLFVVFIKHGERHSTELSMTVSSRTWSVNDGELTEVL